MDNHGPYVFFADRPFPEAYADLVDGRALLVGPADEDLGTAVAVIAGATRRWDAAAFALGPKLRVISRTGIGYDNIDVDAATQAGVVVCNAPAAPTVSTAEHTMALLLSITKGLPPAQARANAGLGPLSPSTTLELHGAVLGLVGLGRIAARVAAAALGLGMRVIAHDPFLSESPVPGVSMIGFDELLETSHVVSLHAPANAATHHLMNAKTISRMRPGSYLINCARGSLIDQEALVRALDDQHLAGAAVDVTVPEPLPAGHPMLGRADLIVTPHIASSTGAGQRRLYEHAIANALAVLEGRPAEIVNPPT